MKKIFSVLIAFFVISVVFMSFPANADSEELRGVWISTVYNIDFPSSQNKSVSEQKEEFRQILDDAKSAGMNAVFVQVRPKADALYSSEFNPWSEFLTGKQGEYPGYDPLEFMVDEAHERGLEIHAWLNPFRVTSSGTDLNALCKWHPARNNPDWTITYNNAIYYDPENISVKAHICETVAEIVKNYDIDGIHFDDYFYPDKYPLPDGEGRDDDTANMRRLHISALISMVNSTIKSIDDSVEFGVSPSGIWKNADSDPRGSNTRGNEAYYSVFADAVSWIENGWIDYIIPQIYWKIGEPAADYETLVKWWNDKTEGTGVDLYIGQAAYKDDVASEITEHLDINRKYSNVKGNVYFSMKDITSNRGGIKNALSEYYSNTENSGKYDTPGALPDIPSIPSLPDYRDEHSVFDTSYEAIYSDIRILVNGLPLSFEVYNINDSNYFKLRDIAMAINGTEKQFNIYWDNDEQAIELSPQESYLPSGAELTSGDGKNKTAYSSDARVILNDEYIKAEAYNIDDYNYFKLRDIAKALDFGITWDDESRTVAIVTLVGYEE